MTSGVSRVSTDALAHVTTEATCPLCSIVLELDDEKPRTGTVRWELSLQFTGVPEAVEDRLRRRVFRALREERARADE